jgi:peroxiredoxin Q/BCP
MSRWSRWFKGALAASSWVVAAACAGPQRPDGGRGLLPVGSPVPNVVGVDQQGTEHALSKLAGRVTVVYFYPKDQTPGCTKEACAFRDAWARYRDAGVMVFGVSSDKRESHRRFAAKHGLEFPLIADTDRAWANAFGVGSTAGLYQRVTFVLGRDGKVAKVYPRVDPGVHASQVLQDIGRL